jgi:predicted metal-dependent phosphotriesterase family hydrolase
VAAVETVHTSGPHQTGRYAVRLFREEGVDLSKVMIGHDANCFIDYFGAAHDAARAAAAPNWHYEHITDDVLPALLADGVTQEQIDTMMVENPVRYFTPAKDGAS